MALFTLVTRQTDGLPLLESAEAVPVANADTCKAQAKAILKRLDARSPSKLSVESGAHVFHYALEDGCAFLVMTDAAFPKRLAFGFLSDLHAEFVAHLRGAHGEAWRARVDTAGTAYAFMGASKALARLKREYADPDSRGNAARLAGELQDVQSIMRQNINEVLDRGERLERERAGPARDPFFARFRAPLTPTPVPAPRQMCPRCRAGLSARARSSAGARASSISSISGRRWRRG
jgi:vesicle transport protein SEC22